MVVDSTIANDDMLNQIRKKDPELWMEITRTELAEIEYCDVDGDECEPDYIYWAGLRSEAQDAWLQHCLQEAIRARGWYLTQWTQSDPIFPEIECVIHCPIKKEVPSGYKGSLFNDYFGRGDTEAEALLRAYLASNPGGSMSQQDVLDCVCRSNPPWEATDERIDGLLAIIGMLNTEVYDTAGPVFEEKNRLVRMLRAMLEEAEHGTKNRR